MQIEEEDDKIDDSDYYGDKNTLEDYIDDKEKIKNYNILLYFLSNFQ